MMFSKRKQLAYRGKKNPPVEGVDIPESALQRQLDDLLVGLGIRFIRIPDNFWQWLHKYSNAGQRMKKELGYYWGGLPDTIALLPISDKYMLACPIELKTKKGKTHGKQKHWGHDGLIAQISRSPEQSIDIMKAFIMFAEKLKNQITQTGGNACHYSQ